MRVFAAIDLRAGRAVQLVGGVPGTERVTLSDPVALARRWVDRGFTAIHVVDLDAALGDGDNGNLVAAVVDSVRGRALVQVGGGIRDDDAVDRTLAIADRVIVGSRAVEDRAWLERAARRWPDRLVVAADVAAGSVLSRGWTRSTGVEAAGFVASLESLPLAGVLITDVDREGREEGVSDTLFATLVAATRHPVLAAGGVSGPADIAALRRSGVAGAILGMALYTGRIAPAEALDAAGEQTLNTGNSRSKSKSKSKSTSTNMSPNANTTTNTNRGRT